MSNIINPCLHQNKYTCWTEGSTLSVVVDSVSESLIVSLLGGFFYFFLACACLVHIRPVTLAYLLLKQKRIKTLVEGVILDRHFTARTISHGNTTAATDATKKIIKI